MIEPEDPFVFEQSFFPLVFEVHPDTVVALLADSVTVQQCPGCMELSHVHGNETGSYCTGIEVAFSFCNPLAGLCKGEMCFLPRCRNIPQQPPFETFVKPLQENHLPGLPTAG